MAREVRAPTIPYEKSISARRYETRAISRAFCHCRYRKETEKGLTDAIAYRKALRKRIEAAATAKMAKEALHWLEGVGIGAVLPFL